MADQIAIEGLDEVLKELGAKSTQIQREAMRGLQKAGLNIIADAKTNLRVNENNATGALRKSGKVEKKSESELEVGFFSAGATGYAYFVEYGRRSGRMPPPDVLEEWLKKKHSMKNNAIAATAVFLHKTQEQVRRSVAWAIAKHIAKKGTRPHPFFQPAVNKNRRMIEQAVSDAVTKYIK